MELDKSLFWKRVQLLYDTWNNCDSDSPLSTLDGVILAYGSDHETAGYNKSISLQKWLFGFLIPETVIIFLKKTVIFYATKTKIEFLKQADGGKENLAFLNLKFILRDKKNDSTGFNQILSEIESSDANTFGHFPKDTKEGELMKAWNKLLTENSFKLSDVSSEIGRLLVAKDEKELVFVKKAATASKFLLKNQFIKEVVSIMQDDKKVKHSKLATNIESAAEKEDFFKDLDVDISLLERCYQPIIQSGKEFQLKFSASSDNKNLSFDTVMVNFGFKYNGYCSNIGRTYLVNPEDDQKASYDALLATHTTLLANLVPGKTIGEAYDAAVDKLKSTKPDLLAHLTKSLGFATGIEFRDSSLSIVSGNSTTIKEGMTFITAVGLADLKVKKRGYAIFISDTVVVQSSGPALELTDVKKLLKNISITLDLGDADESEESEDEDVGRGARAKRRKEPVPQRGAATESANVIEKRLTRQKELFEELQERTRSKLNDYQDPNANKKAAKTNVAYKSQSLLPFNEQDIIDQKLFLDKRVSALVTPIFGAPFPLHISAIKNVSQPVEDGYTCLRINLSHPGVSFNRTTDTGAFVDPDATFVKELLFRARNSKLPSEISPPSINLVTCFRLIKECQKKWKDLESEQKEKEGIVAQDKLVLSQVRGNPRLKDLYIRPSLSNKRHTGALEAHTNGFRYTTIRGETVDILYNNIKHAFFQPCDGEMTIALHFNLKNPIMFGKKKHGDIQFFIEVGEITTDLGKRTTSYDQDDIAAEQAEREIRARFKKAFTRFIEEVDNLHNNKFPDFDTPYRELGFYGSPFRSTCLLMPTSGCLINITDWPPFVMSLSEVELVHFERVSFALKNFDMVFVFKDYSRPPQVIGSIPSTSLDAIKDWLTECDITYTEGVQSLQWKKVMKTITEDVKGFLETGGWTFLLPESDAEDEDSEDEDDEYRPTESDASVEAASGSGSGEDSEDDDDDSEEESDDSGESSFSGESSGSESGKDWDELEAEAEKQDRQAVLEGRHTIDEPVQRKRPAPSSSSKNGPSKKRR